MSRAGVDDKFLWKRVSKTTRKGNIMAYMSHFIATPAPGKSLALPVVEAFVVDLLHSESVLLPAALFVGETRYEPRYTEAEDTEENEEKIRE